MKKIIYTILGFCFIGYAHAQNVGIGTNAPNTNAILDISSSNKAVIIPRLTDTGNVANPTEGMMIFNRNNKAPYFHDGTRWQSLAGRAPSTQSLAGAGITYTVTGGTFTPAEHDAVSAQLGVGFPVSQGSAGAGQSVAGDFTFTKTLDINSNAFQLASLQGQLFTSVEFKFYANGSSTPYISYRFKNVYFNGWSISSGGDLPYETITVNYKNYGFKDYTNNFSFGYDVVTHGVTSY